MSIIIKNLNRFSDFNNEKEKFNDKNKFASNYISFISDLSEKNNNLIWWACPIGSKNPFVSPMYETLIQYFYILKEIELKKEKGPEVHLYIDNHILIPQLKKYCKKHNLQLKIKLKIKKENKISKHINDAKKIILFFGNMIRQKLIIKKEFEKYFKKLIKNDDSYYITRTWIDVRSFNKNGDFSDAYLGLLPYYLKKYVSVISLCGILQPFEKNLLLMKKNFSKHIMIPQQYFLKFSDIIKSICFPFFKKIYFPEKIMFNNIDVTDILKESINDSVLSIQNNLCYYYLTKNIAKKINISHFAYTFENHAWEKMVILALREVSPQTKIIGYQHGGISRMSHHYFLSQKEKNFIPMPDKIITVGEHTKRFLIEYGNYPSNKVINGGALRFENIRKENIKIRSKNKTIFMPLPVCKIECVALLKFLKDSFKNHNDYTLILKEHPLTPIKDIFEVKELNLPNNFNILSKYPIRDLLIKCDILLYFQTTSAIEALLLGIPVIYIDIDRFYDADYIFDNISFKWIVKNPEKLIKVINDIYNLDDDSFEKRQKDGRKYAEKFFSSVTDEKIMEFLNVSN